MSGKGELGEEALPVLEALEADPSLSQRELARRAGLSLTKAHFVLKRLTEKGLVKMQNVARSKHKLGYLYVLTPGGLEAKARLTYRFMRRAAQQYRDLFERVDACLDEALADLPEGQRASVIILGEGPLAEVVAQRLGSRPDTVLVMELEAASHGVVVDPEMKDPVPPGLKLLSLG